jgi:hypothetical protein
MWSFSPSKYISIPVFLVSFAFGMFAMYITTEENRKIIVYPTPDNTDHIQYKDKTGTCFKVEQTETHCPANEKLLSKTPAQA